MADEKQGGFGGILGGLKKMIFTEDYLQSTEATAATQNEVNTQTNTPSNAPVVSNINSNANATNAIAPQAMVDKIYGLLETINKPGIDFFELWNAAEAMGGTTPANIQNAFTTLKVLGLDKNTVVNTGNAYVTELQEKINADVSSKQAEKNNLLLQQKNEKEQLQNDKLSLEKQIQDLNKTLTETNTKLTQVDGKYAPQISTIESKIQAGATALNVVSSEIRTVLETIKNSIN